MIAPEIIRDWARQLLRRGSDNVVPQTIEAATLRVYEELRGQLSASVGRYGFHTLAARALTRARKKSSDLGAVEVTADGSIRSFGAVNVPLNQTQGIILIGELLGLVVTLLGEAITQSLLKESLGGIELAAGGAEITSSHSFPPSEPDAVDDLMALESERLRNTGDRLESIAEVHPGMEEGLLKIAESIRSMANVLDIFTLMRNRSEAPVDDAPGTTPGRYLM